MSLDQQAEIGGTRFTDDYLLYLLAHASAVASGEFHAYLRSLGVPVPTWRVLAVLTGTSGLTVGELARACQFKQPTMTKAIDRMANEGYVERNIPAGDRRRVQVTMTAKGRDLVSGLLVDAKAHESRILNNYSNEEAEHLKTALRILIRRNRPVA